MATIHVPAGGSLQAALDAANPGDTITLEPAATYQGNFQLPIHASGDRITVRSVAQLPTRRITPADAPLLPIIRSGNGAQALGLHHARAWRFDGIQFGANEGGHGNVIECQDTTDVIFDRVLILGGPQGQRRGIAGNGQAITLTRAHLADIWRTGEESQCFAAWDGAGPYLLVDNFLEAASEPFLFGGAGSLSAARIPADILIEGNTCTKNPAWRGLGRVVKNCGELKSAKRATIRRNLFEHAWTDGQVGWAILFTTRNDNNDAPWSVVEDVLFEQNVIRFAERGLNILGIDDVHPSGRTTRITVRHNYWQVENEFFQIGGEAGTVTIEHNTSDNGGKTALLYKGSVKPHAEGGGARAATVACQTLTYRSNLAYHGSLGVFGDGDGQGTAALDAFTDAHTWTHNVQAGGSGTYPSLTLFPSISQHQAEFASPGVLKADSTYRSAGHDGTDLGRVDDQALPTRTVVVPAGQTQASFPIGTASVGEDSLETLSARLNQDTRSATILLRPVPPPPPPPPDPEPEDHGYFEALVARSTLLAAYSLRDQAMIEQYRQSRSRPLDVNYLWPNDPDPRQQDAAKVRIRTDSANLQTQVHLPVPDYGADSLLVTWDVWWGKEFEYQRTGIDNYKAFQLGSPGCSIWTETRARFKLAQPEFPQAVAYTDIRMYGGKGPNASQNSQFPGRSYGNNSLGPIAAEFAVAPETWTRHVIFLEPDGSWYRLHKWLLDPTRGPVKVYDGVQVAPNPESGSWDCFRLEYNTSSLDFVVERGDLTAYFRNLVLLRGETVTSAQGLLIRPR